MAQNYIRQSSFTDGDTITAGLFNNEYNQLVNAFAYSSIDANATGHTHDGSLGQGGNISKIGDLDFLNKIEIDGTNNRMGFFVEVGGVTTEQVRISDGLIVPVTTNDIDLGSASLQFKDAYFDGTVNIDSLVLSSGATVTAILDEDAMTSNSATALATQQSIKAYVDAQVTAQDLDFQGDTGGALSIDLDSETLTIAGGTGIDTAGATNTLTVSIDSTVATLTGTQTLTNKTINADNNTVSNLEVDNLKTGVLDTDISSVAVTHTTLPSALAVKTYVDAQVTAQDLDIVGDTGTDAIDLDSETLTFTGGTGITSVVTAGTVTHNIDSTVATLTGTQTLTNKTISASSNTISNLNTTHLASGVLDTDLTTVSSLHDTIPSAKAVYDYVADLAGSSDPLFTGTVTADNIIVNGNATLGSDASDTLTVNANSTFNGTVDIGSGTIDGTVIGGTSPSAITGTTITGTSFVSSGDMTFGDNDKATFGAGSDLQIYHDGTRSYISDSGTGDLRLRTNELRMVNADNTEVGIKAVEDGAVDLYYNGSAKLATTNTGIDVTGNVALGDNGKAIFGAGDDLQIYHSGVHSFISDVGSGNLYLSAADSFIVRTEGVAVSATFTPAAGVDLNYAGSSKLATTNTGIDVTGTVTADGGTIVSTGSDAFSAKAVGGYAIQAYQDATSSGHTALDLRSDATADTRYLIRGYNDAAGTPTEVFSVGADGTVTASGTANFGSGVNLTASNAQVTTTESGITTSRFFTSSGANISVDGAWPILFNTNSAERVRIDPTGNLLIGQSTIPTGLGASNTKLIMGSFEDGPEFVAYNSDNAIEAGDKVGAYLFGNDDNNATEDHFAGMWAKSASTTGAMDIHFAAGKSNYEDDSPHMTLDSSGTLITSHNIREQIYSLTGTDINPVNGSVQYKTLAANTTFTESLSDGDSVILRLSGADTYTVTWPTMTWVTSGGNAAPTLGGSDVVVLWQESSTVYGAYVGSYA